MSLHLKFVTKHINREKEVTFIFESNQTKEYYVDLLNQLDENLAIDSNVVDDFCDTVTGKYILDALSKREGQWSYERLSEEISLNQLEEIVFRVLCEEASDTIRRR